MSFKLNAVCPLCQETREIITTKKTPIERRCKRCGKRQENYRYVMLNGYVRIRNPHTDKYQYEHRYVWECNNGPVPKGYVIHHSDGNRQNNNIENLELMLKKRHDIETLTQNVKNGIRKTFKTSNQKDFPKELLISLINKGMSIRSIGRQLDTTHGTILRNMRDHNIKIPKKEKKQKIISNTNKITKESLALLSKSNMSQRKIAKFFKVSHTTIQRKLKEFGIND